ncbi:TerC/Alx family metal homeostasis membrane protein [Jiella sp. MQZ9-1]|uniref:TerC/Alx family metal homeostasis membrane protein n=1 Tax=Jiella flava TaxID=2816857 RepID=A0A939FXB8_9HYPH|nr:TerC/Alx family metal homeostasis membrane protein [Jiella flava]MBO0661885.1 TerC/Alx family metal homeostasis membrane protein [Jiella flava]MCD2470787.1 TerC/Alx family metal homeostasis membrane protein [Jiella flava]
MEDLFTSASGDDTIPAVIWLATIAGFAGLFIFDFVTHVRKAHEPSFREAAFWSIFYIVLACLFGGGVFWFWDHVHGIEFFAGFITEKSLSVDNLFVFVIIMKSFQVPREDQQKALLIGIVLALIMRGIFIAIGAAAIERFAWVFYIFGLFLLWTAWKLAVESLSGHKQTDGEYEPNVFVKWFQTHLPVTSEFEGNALTVKRDGKRFYTPMVIVIIALGMTDILFALDSIPAIYGLTDAPYIVFTANAFALLGLLQLYFLLGGLLDRLVYLGFGLALVLGFIGVKLIFHALEENSLPFINGGQPIESMPHISTPLSLGVIIGILVITTIASLLKSRSMGSSSGDH